MIYKILVILLYILTSCGSAISEQNPDLERGPANFQILVDGLDDGIVSLIGIFETVNIRIDSVAMQKGLAHFERTEAYPTGLYYLYYPDKSFCQVLLDADQNFKLATTAGKLVDSMKVEGSVDNELLYESLLYDARYQLVVDSLSNALKQASDEEIKANLKQRQLAVQNKRKTFLTGLFERYPQSFFTVYKKAGQNPDLVDVRDIDGTLNTGRQLEIFRKQFWDSVDFSCEGLIRTPVVANKLKMHLTELTSQHPDSILKQADFLMSLVRDHPMYYKFFANWIVLNYEPTKTTLMDPEAVFTRMVQNYFTYDKAFWSDSSEIYSIQLRAYEMSKSLIGMKAPDVTANDVNGKPQTLLAKTADYLVVYLFNPTCEHCMEQTPELEKFYKKNKHHSIDVYGIAVDTNLEEWREYIASQSLTFTNVFDPTYEAIYAKYYVDITPEIYILNPERYIIAKNIKVNQIETIINRDKKKS